MTEPLRIRTPKETILASIELLPEADLWRPIIEQADDGGGLLREEAEAILVYLGYTPEQFFDWCRQRPFISLWRNAIRDVAELHEFWVAQQP
jgi:hypothetical protein